MSGGCKRPSEMRAETRAQSSCVQNWESMRDTAMWYVAKKRAEHRFDGSVPYDSKVAPTWDMLEGKEVFS